MIGEITLLSIRHVDHAGIVSEIYASAPDPGRIMYHNRHSHIISLRRHDIIGDVHYIARSHSRWCNNEYQYAGQ